jgi:hypothetical protein
MCNTNLNADFFPIPGKEESCVTAFSTSLDGKFIDANLGNSIIFMVDL